MTGTAPLLSVVIPTRERASKLRYTLQTVLAESGDDLEVIVSDNASGDETPEVVAAIRDTRLKSFRTASRLSMCDNWEFAYGKTAGRYLIYIGDDDALLPGAMEQLRLLLAQDPAPDIVFWDPPIYAWPSDGRPAELVYDPASGPPAWEDVASRSRFAFRWGGLRYQRLPLLYHSVVSRSILETVKARAGRLFRSTQPDVFLAFAMPPARPRTLRLGHPLSLYGVSERPVKSEKISEGHAAFARKIDRFMAEYAGYELHPTLYPAAPFWVNMIPDAMLVAADLYPEFYGQGEFRYEAMWAYMRRYWKFPTVGWLWRHRRAIAERQPFRFSRFLGFAAFQDAARVRVAARQRAKKALSPEVPADIASFAISGRFRGEAPAAR